jgi:hypothetical protein
LGHARDFPPAQLVIPTLLSSDGHEGDAALPTVVESALAEAFGPLHQVGTTLDFAFTHYYEAEMGSVLNRLFYVFDELVAPDTLSAAKQQTNRIEANLARDGRRRVNLDPGLLLPGRFILATTKDAAHRIPLSDGIYAEITLLFSKGDFRPLPWTYPDFQSDEYRAVLRDIRAAYVTRVRTGA